MLRTGSVVAAFALAACAAQSMPPDATTRPAATSMAVPVTDAERTIHDQIWPRVTRCYREALQAAAQEGRLVMLIEVDASGKVTDASIGANTGLSDAVAACAQRGARCAIPGARPGRDHDLGSVQPGPSGAGATLCKGGPSPGTCDRSGDGSRSDRPAHPGDPR
jgi:hypothetical protein